MANTYTLIEAKTLGSATSSVTFTTIPQTYTDLLLRVSLRSSTANFPLYLVFNSSSPINVSSKFLEGSGSAASSYSDSTGLAGYTGRSIQTTDTFGSGDIYIPNYTSSNAKSFSSDTLNENNGTEAYMAMAALLWTGTAAITQIEVKKLTEDFVTNSTFYLYGISNS
jgi:hypothetical protein